MVEAIPHDREFRPPLKARLEHADHGDKLRLVARLSRRGLSQHFARKGGRAYVRAGTAPGPSRSVVVKVRIIPHGANVRVSLLAHLRYIQRQGAGEGCQDVPLFSSASDGFEGHAFVDRTQTDSHHLRLIISPEDGRELSDLRAYCRDLMARVEKDLETSLDWVAGVHEDTGRPHVHLVLRGARTSGQALKFPRAYLWSGIRAHAEDLATSELGARPQRTSTRDIRLDQFTPLDRLVVDTAVDGRLQRRDIPVLAETDALRRLSHLESRGWVSQERPGVWRIPPDLRQILGSARDRLNREVTAARLLAESSCRAASSDLVAVDLAPGDRLTGALVGCGFVGPFAGGAHVVVMELMDGRLGHIRAPSATSVLCLDRLPEGAIIQAAAVPRTIRASDQTVVEVAAERNGIWSPSGHAKVRPGDRPAFTDRHLRRLESLAREGACEALAGNRFRIPQDFRARALAADTLRWGPVTPVLSVLDDRSVTAQIDAAGATWLDRLLASSEQPDLTGCFGASVRSALTARSEQLRKMGLGHGDPLRLSGAELKSLGVREVQSAFDELSESTGKAVFLASQGDAVSGVYKAKLHLSGMPFAVIEDRAANTLVKWTPGLEACRGQQILGRLGEAGLEFRSVRALGRSLSL